MTYAEAVAYLLGRVDYEVVGLPDVDDLRLGRMHALLKRLGDPHRKYRIVHVAGTKGKGSTATMIAEILRATGATVGLHLSPHFDRIEERMCVDGREPTNDEFASVLSAVAEAAEEVDRNRPPSEPALTFFELTTAAALEHFARSKVDWAVVEVGVGGRLDATNVVEPAVSAIAEIGLDHTKTLGSTIEAIAAEKAGIIKRGRPVVASATHPDAVRVIVEIARARGAVLKTLGRDFHCQSAPKGWSGSDVAVQTWRKRREFSLTMLGAHQTRNAALAWAAFDALADSHPLPEPASDVLSDVQIPGRLEVLQRDPFAVLLDVAHNEPSAAALADFLETIPTTGMRVLVFAASKDKNWRRMLDRLAGSFDAIVLTQYQKNLRAAPLAQLMQYARWIRPRILIAKASAESWNEAKRLATAEERGLICIAGSFYLAAEIRPLLAPHSLEGPILYDDCKAKPRSGGT